MTSLPPTTEDTVKAATTLAKSSAVLNVIKWAAAVVVPALLGWAAAKLDTQKDILDLRTNIQALTTQQGNLIKRIDDSLPAIQARAVGLQRDVVIATGTALAYESEKLSRAKLGAAEDFARSFDARVSQGMDARAAASDVIHNVSLPRK